MPIKKCGVYRIKCQGNNGVYIGSSVNILSRLRVHKCLLKKGEHPNCHLQNSWNCYGEEVFHFEVVMECEKDQLAKNEYSIISELVSCKELCFNFLLDEESGRAKGSAIASWNDESIEARKESLREFFSNPENREKASKRTKRWASTEANKKRVSQQMKEQWQDPSIRAKRIETLKTNAKENEQFKLKVSEASKANWEREEYRTRISEMRKAQWADPVFREKMSEARKKRWQDSEYKAQQKATRKASWAKDDGTRKKQVSELGKIHNFGSRCLKDK